MNHGDQFSVFEYLYRDAGNWKAWGQLLLAGPPNESEISLLCASLESEKFFIAEQFGIPTLFQKLWVQSGGPTQDDHPWHEFAGVRLASPAEINDGAIWGTMQSLIQRAKALAAWDQSIDDRK